MGYRALLFFLPLVIIIFSVHIPKVKSSTTKYTIQSGDTLYNISRKYNVSVDSIKSSNNLLSDHLRIGKTLIIPSESSGTIVYKVVQGDTLSTIANRYGLSSRDLINENSLENTNIRIGQEIRIPLSRTDSSPSGTASDTAGITADTNTYTVRSGDTLSQIAQSHGVRTSELREANDIEGNRIRPGDILVIPNDTIRVSESSEQVRADNEYEVKSGDTLSQIAERFGVRTGELRNVNNLGSDSIRVGQKLLIPGENTEPFTSRKSLETDETPAGITLPPQLENYTIRRGDTLSTIAVKFGTTTRNLMRLNDMSSTNLVAGNTLKVPAQDSPAAEEVTAVADVSPSVPMQRQTFNYTIRRGDTLHSIARNHGTTVAKIREVNGLSSDIINTGRTLKIPGTEPIRSSDNRIVNYTVRSGDTLSGIAGRFGTTVNEIRAANGLRNNNIRTGSTLVIPAAGAATVRYRVKRGDNLSSIARHHGTTVRSIQSANNMNTTSIREGQVITVPVSVSYNPANYRSDSYDDDSIANRLISVAKRYLGAPYKFGGNSTRTGIDCSAYVNKVFGMFNVNLPRTARDIFKQGEWVNRNELQKGDLVFFTTYASFPSHVGIYIGDDKFIHASSAGKKVIITDLNRQYYRTRYIGAKRLPFRDVFKEQYTKEFDNTSDSYN